MWWSLNDQIIQTFQLTTITSYKDWEIWHLKVLREREWSWWIFALRVLLFLQRFFEAYILSLPLMTVGDLQLAIVKEIWIKKSSCCSCRSSNKCFCRVRDSNHCVNDSNHLCNIWILRQRVIRIRNSKIQIALFGLQLQLAKGFESIIRRFELPCLVFHNTRFRDLNRCVGDSNPCFNLFTCSS